jgi:alkane 1-monooxygenase
LAAVLGIYLVGDQLLGDDISTPHYSYPSILTLQLWLTLPLLTLVVFAMIWSLSPGDPLGCGAWIKSWTGYDVFAQKEKANLLQQFSSIALTALMIGMVGTITAHELVHRTWDPLCLFIGRWLLAYSFDTSFSIEHVYGHHRYVSTASDPSTAPRGRNVYSHIAVSTLRGNVSAWRIERQRLQRTGRTAASWKNAVLRGYLMSFFLLATAWAIGGWQGILAFAISACLGKAVLETVTYVEHYGIVRVSGTPVEPRHSWNCTRRLSSWGSLNVTRHSHHHVQGEVPYHDLKPFVNAPMMFGGYPTTCLLALVPPLWHRVMTPKVLDWDVKHATEGERQLGGEANARSGITLFEQACK